MICRTILFSLAAGFALSLSALEMSGTPAELRGALEPEYPTVTIVGKAKRATYSNLAHVSVLVTAKEDTLTEALAENTRTRQALVAELAAAGIPTDAIRNSQFSSSPHYGFFRGKRPSKYVVENTLRVTARNEAQLLSISRAIDSAKFVELGEIEFEVDNEEQLKAELQLEAMEDATAQATKYEQALSLELEAKSFFFDRRASRVASRGDNRIEEVVVTAYRAENGARAKADVPVVERVTFEKIEYSSAVNVVFEARSNKQ